LKRFPQALENISNRSEKSSNPPEDFSERYFLNLPFAELIKKLTTRSAD